MSPAHTLRAAPRLKCWIPGCTSTAATMVELHTHASTCHSLLAPTTRHFDSEEQLQQWFQHMLVVEQEHYVVRSSRVVRAGTRTLHVCYRSPDGSSGRASKHATATACNTSTKQLKNRCHAGVVVTQVHTGGYEAIICRNHGGHVPRDDPRSQLPLSQACRTFIENELAAGLPRSLVLQHFDAVAHNVRHRDSSLPCLFSGRDLGLSAKDVANVEADLLGLRSKGSDTEQLQAKIAELETLGADNPIVYYKLFGEAPTPEDEALGVTESTDFILLFQTPLQRAAYKAFAHNNVILFDTTHISSSTDYKLATVMAVSNTHKGVPCMYAVISSETKRLLKAVFLVLKDQCDNVVPKWMLTDMALNEWNAATTAYPGLDHRYSE